jgi:hypothetical protein
MKNYFNPNNILSDYIYYIVKYFSILTYHSDRLSNILSLFENDMNISRDTYIIQIENIFNQENLSIKSLKYLFERYISMQSHLFGFFLVGYLIYRMRKYNQQPNKYYLKYLNSHSYETVISHQAHIFKMKYQPMDRSIIPHAI